MAPAGSAACLICQKSKRFLFIFLSSLDDHSVLHLFFFFLSLFFLFLLQVAAVIGIGLVYQGTGHRHNAEVLLSEIGV